MSSNGLMPLEFFLPFGPESQIFCVKCKRTIVYFYSDESQQCQHFGCLYFIKHVSFINYAAYE